MIAKELRVDVRSVQRWRRAGDKGGPRAPRSASSASPPRLSEAQFSQLESELAKGAAGALPTSDVAVAVADRSRRCPARDQALIDRAVKSGSWRVPPLPEMEPPQGLFGVTDPADAAWPRTTLPSRSDQSVIASRGRQQELTMP
ncbi:hypothetical protein QFZ49_005200 [Streptomyces turgidiscabies]|uniref:Transposase n=1 Tax=Streptomyces turgidiscabies TaxID=85558 RepID=A0ABU0RTA6_9ACTN|nr:hypothetical protein [Streptomyces turgidiscabies]